MLTRARITQEEAFTASGTANYTHSDSLQEHNSTYSDSLEEHNSTYGQAQTNGGTHRMRRTVRGTRRCRCRSRSRSTTRTNRRGTTRGGDQPQSSARPCARCLSGGTEREEGGVHTHNNNNMDSRAHTHTYAQQSSTRRRTSTHTHIQEYTYDLLTERFISK